ncbi:MAG: aminoacetone oxidase family FAD-binding enzyme [Bacteroidales bacterium]|jgi:predicted Rossmann fold flavoprotein|nr:aminoacetone oxidase family FAD-binding enzyme [Bacteroidales bacterium]
MMSDIIVIGGGAAGMMAAIKAAERGCKVTLLEKNEICGKKILITGKGRCNLTNTKSWSEFSTHIHPSANFLKPAFFNFSNTATIEFFNSIGLPTSVEQGDRVFPLSMRASDVPKVLVALMQELGVDIRYSSQVLNVSHSHALFHCVCGKSDSLRGKRIEVVRYSAPVLIIATGGLSYPGTGSTGDGYDFARSLEHSVTETFPSLTALMPRAYDADLVGIELRNVGLSLFIDMDLIKMEDGELTFTSNGIEGALGFRLSRRAVQALIKGQRVELVLDLKPALSLEKLRARISRDLKQMGATADNVGRNRFRALLRGLIPAALVSPFQHYHKDLNVSNLPDKLKEWRFEIKSYTGYERAVVTAGGIPQKEIIAKTMASRKQSNLYFAGEIIDIDGDTGGYNLQVAFSTGALAGESAAQQILKLKSS